MDENDLNENNQKYQNSNIVNFIRPSKNDSIAVKNNFFSKHPIQPMIPTSKSKLNFKEFIIKSCQMAK